MNASRIAIMSDEDMGRYASGGFGLTKRDEFLRVVRQMAKEQTQLQAVNPPSSDAH